MLTLPSSLSRRAICQTFNRLEPVTWEKLFEREDGNGLAKWRVNGDYKGKSYYDTHGIMEWLVRNGHYTLSEVKELAGDSTPNGITVRTHALAG